MNMIMSEPSVRVKRFCDARKSCRYRLAAPAIACEGLRVDPTWEESDEALSEGRSELLVAIARGFRCRLEAIPAAIVGQVGLTTHNAFVDGYKHAFAAPTLPIRQEQLQAALALSSESGYHARTDEVTVVRPPPKPAPGQRRTQPPPRRDR